MKNWTHILTKPYLMLALGVVVGGIVIATMDRDAKAGQPRTFQPVQQASFTGQDGSVSGLEALDQMYTDLSAYASQAAVHIAVKTQTPTRFGVQESGGDGAGFIFSSDGWIVTNDHVVHDADEVNVILADGRSLKGKVTLVDDDSLDIALVKVDAKDLPVLKFADSDTVRPGQIVLAVGSPFGFENSVTFGHVSAVGRPGAASDGFQDVRYYSGMIQTDASINPGNSGGPLINVQGEVIGVNTSIFSTSGASAGIGFAIPGNVVKAVAEEVRKNGKFDRGLLGVVPRDLKGFESKQMGLVGAFVLDVDEGSAAYKAGLRQGDVIVKIDGEPIKNEIDLRVSLYRRSPDQKISLDYVREGRSKTTQLTLSAPIVAQEPVMRQAPRGGSPFGDMPDLRELMPPQKPALGVYIYTVDDTSRAQYNLPGGVEGAVIYRFVEGSRAKDAGLQEGDVITKVGDATIKTTQDVVDALNRLQPGDSVELKYIRMKDGKAILSSVTIRF